uniref:Uncharacterized protein n=1 Tax=Anguilla anguilla TaxID=7936 RepID=A0A0E9UAH5_ANGAN
MGRSFIFFNGKIILDVKIIDMCNTLHTLPFHK